ncbi:MAG: hypothetical protein RIG84_05610, partial [Roseovarius sp.]
MDILEQLERERAKISAERDKACLVYDRDLAELDAAIKAVKKSRGASPKKKRGKVSTGRQSSMPIDEAVIVAVKAGASTPVKILEYMENTLGVDTT